MSKPTKELAKTPPSKPALLKEFDGIRKRVETIRNLGRRAGHESILLGHDLNRVKAEIGTRQGGDHTSEKAKSQFATLLPWKELVEQQTGLGYDACNRCMQLALAAKKQIPILTSADVLKKPLSALPAARQTEVLTALEKAADGRSMTDLMYAFGAWKDKKSKGPPKATKASAAKRGENATDEVLTQAQLMELGKGHIGTVQEIDLSGAYKALDTDDLASLENVVSAFLANITGALKERRKAA